MTLALHGGTPIRTKPFPPRNTYGAEERDAALTVVESGMLSAFRGSPGDRFNGGPYVQAFERAWCEAFGYRHAITVNSWTTGLAASMQAAGVGAGDEVIVPAYTMSATATAALMCGATVLFADVDPETFCIDPESVELSLRTARRPRAIVAVHLFGGSADLHALRTIADRHGLALIEDAAQSPGVRYQGRPVGTFGHIGGFSLTQTKHIHTGEGGIIVTDSDEMAEYCRRLRNHGENLNEPGALGGNYRLTELQAAIGLAQLSKLPGILGARQWLAEALTRELRDIPGLTLPKVGNVLDHAWFTYPLTFDPMLFGTDRSTFVSAVNAELGDKVFTEGYVEPLHGRWAYGGDHRPLPVVEGLHSSGLVRCRMVREPMMEDDMTDIAEAVRKVAEHVDTLNLERV